MWHIIDKATDEPITMFDGEPFVFESKRHAALTARVLEEWCWELVYVREAPND